MEVPMCLIQERDLLNSCHARSDTAVIQNLHTVQRNGCSFTKSSLATTSLRKRRSILRQRLQVIILSCPPETLSIRLAKIHKLFRYGIWSLVLELLKQR